MSIQSIQVKHWYPNYDPARDDPRHSHRSSYQGLFRLGERDIEGNAILFAADGVTEIFSDAATGAAREAAKAAIWAVAELASTLEAMNGAMKACQARQRQLAAEKARLRLDAMEKDGTIRQRETFELEHQVS